MPHSFSLYWKPLHSPGTESEEINALLHPSSPASLAQIFVLTLQCSQKKYVTARWNWKKRYPLMDFLKTMGGCELREVRQTCRRARSSSTQAKPLGGLGTKQITLVLCFKYQYIITALINWNISLLIVNKWDQLPLCCICMVDHWGHSLLGPFTAQNQLSLQQVTQCAHLFHRPAFQMCAFNINILFNKTWNSINACYCSKSNNYVLLWPYDSTWKMCKVELRLILYLKILLISSLCLTFVFRHRVPNAASLWSFNFF